MERVKMFVLLVLVLAMVLGTTGIGHAARGTVVAKGQDSCRQVALTFDGGGYVDDSAVKILKILARHNARSSFYLTGRFVDRYPGHTMAIAQFGHEISNHSDTHPDFRKVSVAQMRQELRAADAKIRAVTGVSSKPYWRPPYGAYNALVVQTAAEEGYPYTIMWTVDTIDWQNPSVQTIVKRVLDKVQPGGDVLMHLGAANTGDALEIMIPALEKRGYMLVTVGELLGHTRSGADFGGRTVYAQSGDTLSAIGRCFNTRSAVLAAANNISASNPLVTGKRLYVPLKNEVSVRVDGRKLELATPALVVNERTFVHVRAVAENLETQVTWNGALQQVTISKAGTTIVLTIGSQTARVNGTAVTLDVAPYLQDSRTQVPVRFIAEALGAAVDFDVISRTVLITR